MAERYELAAVRHHEVAELLQGLGHFDDAAYHFGVCGENAIKHALQACGVEAYWIANNVGLHQTPMRGHFTTLTSKVIAFQQEIALNATGRLAGVVSAIVSGSNFSNLFQGWSIDIRYADDGYTPVTAQACTNWGSDASDLMLSLVVY